MNVERYRGLIAGALVLLSLTFLPSGNSAGHRPFRPTQIYQTAIEEFRRAIRVNVEVVLVDVAVADAGGS